MRLLANLQGLIKPLIFLCAFCIGWGGYQIFSQFYVPTVSVVMPVYNREKLVADAIESVLNQTFTDFEFIIVDDGSTDNTMQILKAYAEKDKRIRLIAHDKNCGVGCGRNTAQRNARGQFLAIMDSDDIMSPTRLEKQVTVMQENPHQRVC